jgi:hypothetical protein
LIQDYCLNANHPIPNVYKIASEIVDEFYSIKKYYEDSHISFNYEKKEYIVWNDDCSKVIAICKTWAEAILILGDKCESQS